MVLTKPTLLIVDDDASIRNTLTLIFSELGYCVRSASDGLSALALCRESEPEILLSDLNMPGMSGFKLLSVVRGVYPAIYVIATSGAFSGKNVPPGVSADAFYEKATSLSFLFEVIKQGAQFNIAARGSSDQSIPLGMDENGKFDSDGISIRVDVLSGDSPHANRTMAADG
jgi:CheY-like chemotaxis protein